MTQTSLIIPAHNEEYRLEAALALYSKALWRRYQDSFEIIVVANGCKDRTVEVANEFIEQCDRVKVIDIPEPIGKGGAVLEGFRQSYGEEIAFVDADGATSPDSLLALLQKLDTADMVIGSRWLKGSQIERKQPLPRRVCSRLFNLSIRAFFHLPYHDTQCGVKTFRRLAARKLSTVVQETRWTFDVDLLLWAKHFHMKVVEVPVAWNDQPGSQLKYGSTFQEVLSSLWRMKHRKMSIIEEYDPVSAAREVTL